MRQLLPTTVFVIDDDDAVLKRVTRESLRNTNLGVLTAQDLTTAVDYFKGGFPIGAVLADLNFRTETQNQSLGIYDGFDLLAYVQRTRPELPLYVLSIDVDDPASRRNATAKNLNIRGWYDKLKPVDSQFSPWQRIERDLICDALKAKDEFRQQVTEAGESPMDLLNDERVAEKVQGVMNYPRLTYLQRLPAGSPYRLKRPIEVHCWPTVHDGDEFFAAAVRIPLLDQEARGEDLVYAIEALAQLLVDEKKALDAENEQHLKGYASFITQRFNEYLELI